MELAYIFLFLCFVLFCCICNLGRGNKRIRRPPVSQFLPGPWSFPVIGNLEILMCKDKFQLLSQLRLKYGDLYSISFGKTRIVVLNDFRLVKDAFIQWKFSGKPMGSHAMVMKVERNSIEVDVDSKEKDAEWFESRRFLIQSLQQLGFGTPLMQTYFYTEITKIIGDFRKLVGQPTNPHDRLRLATVNPVWQIATGNTWKVDDPEFLKLKVFIFNVSKCCKIFLKGNAFPWLTSFQDNDYQDYLKNKAEIRNILKDIISRHDLEEYKTENLIDLYLQQISTTSDQNSCFYANAGESTLMFALEDLLLGGSEATSTVIMWAFFILGKYPEVQNKLSNEIQEVIGYKSFPSVEDRKMMPYTEAVIMEVMRFCGLNPLTHHKTMEDTTFQGYRIPKDATIVANFTEIFQDPLLWGDPENFRPERFLDVDLKCVIRHEAFLMFSVGKRMCPAEKFSRDQIFIYLTSICQNFNIQLDPKSHYNAIDVYSGVFRYPKLKTPIVFFEK